MRDFDRDKLSLEEEFFAYVYYWRMIWESDRMIDLSLIKINKDDKSIPDETKKGIAKALGQFIEPTVDAARERIANLVRTPHEKSVAAITNTITKLTKAGLSLDDIKEIPYDIKTIIFNGIEYGNSAHEIQNKWKKLLEASIAGKPVRKDYAVFMDTLEPVEARLLDKIYSAIKAGSLEVLRVEDLIDELKIKDYEEELLISIDKLLRNNFQPLRCTYFSKVIKSPYKYSRTELIKNLETIKKKHPFNGLVIEDAEGILPVEPKDDAMYENYKVLNLSWFGTGFMKIVSE